MSNFNEAADAIRRAAKLLEGFQVAADALDRVGSFDNAAKDATKARDKAYKEAEAAKAELNNYIVKVEAAKAEANKILEDANLDGSNIIAVAKTKADAVAAEIIDAARARSSQIMEAATDANKQLSLKNSEMLAAVDALVLQHTEVSGHVAAKQKQLDELNKAFDKLKAKLGD